MSQSFKPIPADDGAGIASRPGVETKASVPEIPIPKGEQRKALFPPLTLYPKLPAALEDNHEAFTMSWPSPAAGLPANPEGSDSRPPQRRIDKPVFPDAPVPVSPVSASPFKIAPEPYVSGQTGESPFTPAPPLEPEYSDKDLKEALAPLMQDVVREAVYSGERSNVDAMLEPMLRATVRRALAEYSPANRPFEAPGFMDRAIWRMQALFSSRTFEDVMFEKTHRFQVDEVFLFDAKTLALVSFASCDPARHCSAKRVERSAHRIAMKLRDEEGNIQRSYERADGRNVISEAGDHVLLAAVVRGQPNEVILADLGFCLHRIEVHFQERFEQAGSALMHALQPFLEDCLLIQAPASAA